jgi:biotin-dependent carboxylase-like uncharacterized protein
MLALGMPPSGLRTYVTVRGGILAPVVLGSRSTDVLAALGPPALRAGDVLDVGPAPSTFPQADLAPLPGPADEVVLRMTPGPRLDWCDDARSLVATPWIVSDRSDRIGIRLQGKVIRRSAARRDDELPSEGMVRGAVQLPPGGEPVLFLADHPVTGGYPVVAVVDPADTDRAAQLRPGESVHLRWR